MYNIKDYGSAEGSLATKAIQSAVDAAYENGGGTVFIPEGEFICGTVVLRDNIHIVFENGSVLLGSDNMDDFLPREENPANDIYQDKSHSYFQHSLFYADGCKNISFSGLGKIDMRSVWEPDGSWQRAVKIFALKNCTDVVIKDLVLRNATDLAVYFAGCENVTVTGLNIFTHIDGISPDSCKNVVISDCIINSGDDGIVPKSSFTLGRFAAMENLTISNCIISSRCNAIKFGTESNTAFLNVSITGCTIYNTRFSGITLQAVDGATVNGFSVSGITMKNVGNPIMLMVLDRSRAPEGTPIGEIKNVSLSGITVTGPYEPWEAPTWNYKSHMEDDKVQCPVPAPVIIAGQPDSIIKNVSMSDIIFSMPGGGTKEDRDIKLPEVRDGYPESIRFGYKTPCFGMIAKDVDNLRLYNVDFSTEKEDARDEAVFVNVTRYKRI